jgi:uncharacterized damage-inducible protein DinB
MSEVSQLVYLMDEAFEGTGIAESNESQSLMVNLATVEDRAWRARPAGIVRTIESIALHIGSCKVMYRDHAFGSRTLTSSSSETQPWADGEAPMASTMEWLRQAHDRLMLDVRSLTDQDLTQARCANWGELRETRWLLSMLLQHDVYHSGEINHLRSLIAGEDRWNWQIVGGDSPLSS